MPPTTDLDDFLDLLTYTCPITGRSRCAVSAGLQSSEPMPGQNDWKYLGGSQYNICMHANLLCFWTWSMCLRCLSFISVGLVGLGQVLRKRCHSQFLETFLNSPFGSYIRKLLLAVWELVQFLQCLLPIIKMQRIMSCWNQWGTRPYGTQGLERHVENFCCMLDNKLMHFVNTWELAFVSSSSASQPTPWKGLRATVQWISHRCGSYVNTVI